MMDQPVVSVCIPVYNGMPFVGETVQSVLHQTFADFELIISDNASTDGTSEALGAIDDPRVRLIHGEENVGAIANWNRVAKEARGEYVKMLPADDLLYPTCLERQVEAFRNLPEDVVMVVAKRDIIDQSGRIILRSRGLAGLVGTVAGSAAVKATVLQGTNVFGEPGSVLIRRSALDKWDPLFDKSLPYVVDLRLWCNLLSRGSLFAMEDPLGAFRIVSTSESAALSRRQRADVRALFEMLKDEGMVTAKECWIGSCRAFLLSLSRRAFYLRTRF